jgi:protease II
MTGELIRDTQFASWIDPDAWMEHMKGPKWISVLNEEDDYVEAYKKSHSVNGKWKVYESEYKSAKDQELTLPFQHGPLHITWINMFVKSWYLEGSNQTHEVRDICFGIFQNQPIIWCTKDVGNGAESFELQAWTLTSKTPIWKKYPVGPELGLVGTNLYYLGVKNKLIYHELWCCNATTGNHAKRIYKETNPEVNLALERHGNGRLKLIRENAQTIEIYEIFPTGMLHRRTSKYPIPASWILPLTRPYGIEFVWQTEGILLLKQFGKQILWKCAPHKAPKKLIEIPAGQILFDPYAVWCGVVPTLVCITQPHIGKMYYIYNGTSLELVAKPTKSTGLVCKRISGLSKDGTNVYGIVTYLKTKKPTKLLMIGYGAYGLPTNVGSVMTRWAPLVQNGWAIGHAFLRGGGDHTDAWAKAGCLEGRQKTTIEDFIALTRSSQHVLHILPSHTAIYGRSAGGLLVGDTLAKYPSGSLMSAVYTEVPYVDELRTTTNSELPLTNMEANEFGNPMQRLEDFIQVGLLSPADSAATLRTPNIFVLARTATNDSQVFAYESVKWIRRLRTGSCVDAFASTKTAAPKLCIVERGQGHFTPPDVSNQQWALDAVLLDSWMEEAK